MSTLDPWTGPNLPKPRLGLTVAAWVVAALMCLAMIVTHHLEPPAAAEGDQDAIGTLLMRIQGQYAVGVTELLPMGGSDLYRGLEGTLNVGSVGQRQRFIILAADLAGPGQAATLLGELDSLLTDPPKGEPAELTKTQAQIQETLHRLYPARLEDLDEQAAAEASDLAIAALDDARRAQLVEQFGWFGNLALAPPTIDDQQARQAVLRPARTVAAIVLSAAVVGALAGLAGLIGLILLIVFTATGRLHSALGPRLDYHGVYAETFAVWMVLFLGLQLLAGLLVAPESELLVVIAMFFVSLVALAWPVLRGVPWKTVRQDVGLTLGRVPLLEPLVGAGAYLATLPLLLIGLMMTLALMAIQGMFLGEPETFAPAGGPAHPVIAYMNEPSMWPKIQLLLLAAVAAPIVEETMFRGVLYRHLRSATSAIGLATSVVLSVAISGFIFAAIHPQGFVAIPALMGLACGMALVREWRGTLIPSMLVHGISNGLIMGLLIVVLGV